ncbi:MAG: VanZ family protein [Nanoarchaeota archaeon]|nr:VanZ family protein [Nanoarchaeota archaeon]MBU1988710.1 VanZ family protein [Nanoarchaeota archaeon]
MISWFEKHRGVCWLFTILIGVVIFYVSSLVFEPGVGVGTSINALFYHLMAFFFFGFFLLMSLVGGKKRRLFVLGIVLAVVYGISDELHQFFVPGRHMSLFDIFLDTTGIVFAAMIYFIWVESGKGK